MLRETLMKYRGPLLVVGTSALMLGGSLTKIVQNSRYNSPPIVEEMGQTRREVSDINAYLDSHPKPDSETYLDSQTTRDSLERRRDKLENTIEGISAISEKERRQKAVNNSLIFYIMSTIPLTIGLVWGLVKKRFG